MTTSDDLSLQKDTNQTSGNHEFAVYYPYLMAEMSLSIFCLVFLIVIYCRIQEHKTTPGRIVISLSTCFIMCYVLLILDFTVRAKITFVQCIFVSFMIHIHFLAAFFWTNVMAYDIMKTMSSVKPNVTNSPSAGFWKYFLYAWAMTLIFSLPAFIVDNVKHVSDEFRPKFGPDKNRLKMGRKQCWLNGNGAFMLYFMTPVGLILLANCCMFGFTAITISKVKKIANAAQIETHSIRFRLYISLFVVMGLFWMAEFVPWMTGLFYLYAVTGFVNCLHGVFIFIIFVCKSRVWNKFKSSFEKRAEKTSPPVVVFQASPSVSTMVCSSSVNDLKELDRGDH